MSYSLNFSSGKEITDLIQDDKVVGKIYLYDEKYKCKDNCNGKCCSYHKKKDKKNYEYIKVDNDINLLPSWNNIPNQISIFYITGAQGTGKSVLAAKLMKIYKRQNKGCPIYCVSECKQDDTIDDIITKKITPEDIRDDDLSFNDFQDIAKEYGSLCILFDDIDSCSDVKKKGVSLKHLTYQLLNSLINNSRKYNINIIYTSHRPCEGAYSKTILNSCSNWIFFTQNITNNIKLCMKEYMGLSKKQQSLLLNLESRWVSINRTIPLTITTENECFILPSDKE